MPTNRFHIQSDWIKVHDVVAKLKALPEGCAKFVLSDCCRSYYTNKGGTLTPLMTDQIIKPALPPAANMYMSFATMAGTYAYAVRLITR